ncbi:hypothetical protein VTK26DRAFT_8096 [Humicola hyalothermophila]
MPSLKQPRNGGVVSVAPVLRRYCLRTLSPHLCFVFAVITVLGAIVILFSRSRRSQSRVSDPPLARRLSDIKNHPGRHLPGHSRSLGNEKAAVELSPVSADERHQLRVSPGLKRGHRPSHNPLPARRWSLNVASAQFTEMDGHASELGEDHRYPSAPESSRAVSTTDPGRAYPCHPGTVTVKGRAGLGYSLSQQSSVKQPCRSTNGIDTATSEGQGKSRMAGDGDRADGSQTLPLLGRLETPSTQFGNSWPPAHQTSPCPDLDFAIPHQFTRPPLPPPLTPPTPHSTAQSAFEARRPSHAASIAPEVDRSFIHQPNPEYTGGSTLTDVPSSSPRSQTAIPRRRPYTKSVPIGIPLPTRATSEPSLTETATSRRSETFFPASYPPTSPLLPPPPPISGEEATASSFTPPSAPPEYQFVGGPGGPGVLLSQQEIDLQGEIISVVDGAGHGWKRHTRVYGGGVCLACAAARGRDGELGGFYGDNVPLEDRR